jgi:transglutaminase-like putative cysteine protease
MGLAHALRRLGVPFEGGFVVSSEGRARIGLAALLLLTLLAYAQVFSSGDYPGPALLGMALASGIAIAARRLGAGTLTTALVSVAALVVYLVVVFQARNSFYLLPSPDALAGLARSVSNALRHSSVDYAPVPVRTGYVVLVVAGMWAATTVGEIATFRWRRPLLAALPCIGLFCIQMTVGTGNGAPVLVIAFLLALLTYWGLESAHRVRSWGRWVPAFPGREGKEPESVTGALARRMGAGCVAAAIVAPLVVPALGDGLLVWRNDVGSGGFGSGGSGEINPLVSIAPQLLQQTDSVLFTVRSERSTYWRLLSLARFDGRDWERVEGTAVESVADGVSFEGQSNSPRSAEPLEQTVTFQELESTRLPAAINPEEVDLEDGVELTYDTENQDLTLSEQAAEGFTYTVTSNTPELTYDELTEAKVGDTLPVYTEAPDASPQTVELARGLRVDRVTGDRLSDGQFLIALQEELRTKFEYSDDPELVERTQVDGASSDYLHDFLFEVRAGYCQQFATAFALLARIEGIPTRVAVGFLPGSRDIDDDTFTVTGVETHAWPEVFFEEYGWVRFDPTPRVQASAPGYTRAPLETDGPGGGGPDGGVAGAISRQEQIFRDRRLAGENVGAGLLAGERPIGGDFTPGGVSENPAWITAFNRLAISAGALLLAFLASVPALKRWRITRRYRTARGADQTAAAAFRHFEDEAAELAQPRRPAESAASYAIRLAKLRAVPSEDASRLAQIYEASQYAEGGVGRDQARQARVLARKLRAVMWARASWWTRAARLFSPRGLVGRS